MRGVLNDAVSIYFLDATLARRLLSESAKAFCIAAGGLRGAS
jgi:hypothetical protein